MLGILFSKPCAFRYSISHVVILFKFKETSNYFFRPTITISTVLYPLQYGFTPLHYAARGGHTTCVEHLLSTPGIDVNIKSEVSCRS